MPLPLALTLPFSCGYCSSIIRSFDNAESGSRGCSSCGQFAWSEAAGDQAQRDDQLAHSIPTEAMTYRQRDSQGCDQVVSGMEGGLTEVLYLVSREASETEAGSVPWVV